MPRLATFGFDPNAGWEDLGHVADRVRRELDIDDRLWAQAIRTLSTQECVMAVAIILAKWPTAIRKSPGAYLHGMIQAARDGRLNLLGSLFGLRQSAPERSGNPIWN